VAPPAAAAAPVAVAVVAAVVVDELQSEKLKTFHYYEDLLENL
jgi:hypothetical protein